MTARSAGRTASTVALLVAVAGFAVVVIVSDIADSGHAAWRDPISYFGSPQAPHPGLFNGALAVLGCLVVAWSLVRLPLGPTPPLVFVAVAGAASVALSIWSIDCSPVDDLCEAAIRADLTSGAHDAHSYLAVVLFLALAAITVEHATVRWRAVRGLGRWVVGATAAAGIGGLVLLIARAFSAGSGVVEVVAVVAAVVALRERVLPRAVEVDFTRSD